MGKILHGTVATGYGGLEMVVEDFHEWLIDHGHEAHVIVAEGTPLHKRLSDKKSAHTVHVLPRGLKGYLSAIKVRQKYNTPDTAFLFHRQTGLRILIFLKLRAKVSVLSHTFYGVKKTDFWHRLLFKKVNQWIALTSSHSQNVIETCGVEPKKIAVIPNGINLNRFKIRSERLPDPEKRIHVGVIARLDEQKGQLIAIQAVAELRKKGVDICLHLFGSDTPDNKPYRPVLEKKIQELNLSENIVFEAFEAHIEKRIPELDIVWMPSFKETFGLCILEAMACAVPVIASNAGGVPDIIEDGQNGLHFETKNPMDLALKTVELIQNRDLYQSIRTSALLAVRERYDREKIWNQLLNTILPETTH